MNGLKRIDGACHCGQVSFTALIDPSRVMVCHCNDCQVMSGAPMRAVVAAAPEGFTLQGETRRYVKVAQSGRRRAQVFCPECGTPLFATDPDAAAPVIIRLGCVAQRAELAPAAQIWTAAAMPWLPGLAAVPGSAGQQAFLPAPPLAT
jgi:hypothetical protein